jgi:hypothetical protein
MTPYSIPILFLFYSYSIPIPISILFRFLSYPVQSSSVLGIHASLENQNQKIKPQQFAPNAV